MMNDTDIKENEIGNPGAEFGGPLQSPHRSVEAKTDNQSIRLRQATWLMWWAGTALIVLSWFKVVSNQVGWIGFAAALASSVVSVVANKYWRIPK
jgi:hypothetical protein